MMVKEGQQMVVGRWVSRRQATGVKRKDRAAAAEQGAGRSVFNG
jgi:hypothetical protein